MNHKSFFIKSLKIKTLVWFVVLMTGLYSCQTVSYIDFQVLRPGKVNIPSDVKTMAFVDRNVSYKWDTLRSYYKVNDLWQKDSICLDTIIGKSCYEGMVDNLSEYLTSDSIAFVRMNADHRDDKEPTFPAMEWQTVDSICEANGSDILITLEDIQITNKYMTDGNWDEGFYGANDISYWAVWRIYDPLQKKYHDQYLAQDSLFMEEYDNSLNSLMEDKMLSREQTMREVAYVIGQQYAQRISPYWNDVERTYYCYGGKKFEAACYFIKQNQWKKAIPLWKSVIEEDDGKKSGKAAFNLALAYEMEGDLKEAVKWVRKSIFYHKKENQSKEQMIAEAYSLILIQRKEDQKRLKEFFGE